MTVSEERNVMRLSPVLVVSPLRYAIAGFRVRSRSSWRRFRISLSRPPVLIIVDMRTFAFKGAASKIPLI